MKEFLKPTWYIQTIYTVHAQDLLDLGIKGMMIDLDNTLLAWNELDANSQLIEWIQEIKDAGIKICLLSNNRSHRVARVADAIDLNYIANALKPFPHSFKRVISSWSLLPEEIVVVGDQMVTDVIGAKCMGLKVILVKPLVEHDNIYTRINRLIEKALLRKIGINREKDWGNQLVKRP